LEAATLREFVKAPILREIVLAKKSCERVEGSRFEYINFNELAFRMVEGKLASGTLVLAPRLSAGMGNVKLEESDELREELGL
jgi:hypothetical protein